jgi:hypothetical protein
MDAKVVSAAAGKTRGRRQGGNWWAVDDVVGDEARHQQPSSWYAICRPLYRKLTIVLV